MGGGHPGCRQQYIRQAVHVFGRAGTCRGDRQGVKCEVNAAATVTRALWQMMPLVTSVAGVALLQPMLSSACFHALLDVSTILIDLNVMLRFPIFV